MRRVPCPWACLAFLGLRSWEGEAGSCQVPALGLACESACVSLIRPLSFLSTGPSFLYPCRGHKDASVGVGGITRF